MDPFPASHFFQSNNQPVDIVVSNLPEDKDQTRIKNRLKQLSDNCGGRVVTLSKSSATIRFATGEFATR
jgi:meiosis arrest female protein 1